MPELLSAARLRGASAIRLRSSMVLATYLPAQPRQGGPDGGERGLNDRAAEIGEAGPERLEVEEPIDPARQVVGT